MLSPAHFFDTAYGGSAHGLVKGGLTDAGREQLATATATWKRFAAGVSKVLFAS